MRMSDFGLSLTATDLARHLACRHLTELERAVAEAKLDRPHRNDPALEMLIRRGIEHEQAYIAHLQDGGKDVTDLRGLAGDEAMESTRTAMREGANVIVQAALEDGRWRGRADLLIRTDDLKSDLGYYSYEAADTKLARNARGDMVLQLALYSDLVRRIQNQAPRQFHVVKPGRGSGDPFDVESFRVQDYDAYYRLVRRRLEERVDGPSDDSTYPHPVSHCEICAWWTECDKRRRKDDHLSLVAGLQRLHTDELNRQGVLRLDELARRGEPLDERPKRGHRDTYRRLHGQAQIQLEGRESGEPRYELLEVEPERGFLRLPEPSAGDVFFDLEADPYVSDEGLEYLWGWVTLAEDGRPQYERIWVSGPAEEKRAFERFVDILFERLARFPELHVYHFSPYEPGALKRLMGRHATREEQIDWLLRGDRLVDLMAVTRQGLRCSVESYGLKELEPFFGFARKLDLREARLARQRVDIALESGAAGAIADEDRAAVEAYNREDCESTLRLRDWLEERRAELLAGGVLVPRPPLKEGDASEALQERSAEVQEVYEALVAGLPDDPEERDEAQYARFLLANLLDFFRREDKCKWWELFRLNELDHEELLDERKAVTGLRFVGEVEGGPRLRVPVHRYRYPPQELTLDVDDELSCVGEEFVESYGTVFAIDPIGRTLDLKKRRKTVDLHLDAAFEFKDIRAQTLDRSLLAFARAVVEHGVDGEGPYAAGRAVLLRALPLLKGVESGGALRRGDETAGGAAVRLVRLLRESYLAIQGPPGSGKTYSGGEMIARLVADGKRIGVTAVSHKVIRNLLDAVVKAGERTGVDVRATHKVTNRHEHEETDRIRQTTDNGAALAALGRGEILGGTGWLWARDEAEECLDYLFVDEAGQLALANLLASCRAARNIVLLGDPQQLEQPRQASHPHGADTSALEHLLGDRVTMPDDRGLFLDRTWRLHPKICEFTSEVFYEDRLKSHDGRELQALTGPTRFAGSGLWFVPVEHSGNQNRSDEEVEAIVDVVSDLLGDGVRWIDMDGDDAPLTEEDILVVAPYNVQVGALTEALPDDVRVGTVDKFQGQEAPVVIYSMTSSSAEEAPRGMNFLYDPHRFNVATSRARCACIVAGSPALLEAECRSPEQMRWANVLCRYVELAN